MENPNMSYISQDKSIDDWHMIEIYMEIKSIEKHYLRNGEKQIKKNGLYQFGVPKDRILDRHEKPVDPLPVLAPASRSLGIGGQPGNRGWNVWGNWPS